MFNSFKTKPLDKLKKLVDRKQLKRAVYVHADHFEPWQGGITPQNADNVVAFAEAVKKKKFSRKLTLFYKPWLPYAFARNPGPDSHIPGEPIVFRRQTEGQARIAREAMRELVLSGDHEIGVHIHHEGFTASDVRRRFEMADWLANCSNPGADADRFELYLQLSIDAIRQETGLELRRWGFVHGNWALNASDHSICRIASEMAILARNGCFGDFTFPAGRRHVDPHIKHPFTCLPLALDRAYDLPAAAPRIVLPGAGAFAPGRFFIWSATVKNVHCSIDYHDEAVRRALADTEAAVVRLIEDSVHFDGTVYVKTHGHSMARHYWEGPVPVIPHLYPGVHAILSELADTCQKLGIALEFGTASSIVDELNLKSDPAYKSTALRPRVRNRPEVIISKAWKSPVRIRNSVVIV